MFSAVCTICLIGLFSADEVWHDRKIRSAEENGVDQMRAGARQR